MNFEEMFGAVKARGAIIEKAMQDDMDVTLAGSDPLLSEVLHYGLFSGGKRIRPLLVVLAAEICGNRDEQVQRLAIAFEYLHVATLVHDDVIDHARKRRGRLSVTEKYGPAAAILTGDWLHARSMSLVARYAGPSGLAVFSTATAAMVDGEFLQLRHQGKIQLSEEDYFSVIEKKTAGLIAAACETGALFAGASADQVAVLKRYGRNLGLAFQIIDDLLDYQGDAENTGKKIGNDFMEGKITLPLLLTLQQANSPDHNHLADLLATKLHRDDFDTVCDYIKKYQGFDLARHRAEELVEKAINGLKGLPEPEGSDSRSILITLAQYVLKRDR